MPADITLISAFLVGLLGSSMLGALLLVIPGRARRIEAAVRERTAALQEKTLAIEVSGHYTLDDVEVAHERLESRRQIGKAVAGLEKNTGEARRILYERARNALVTQLRSVTPPLSESDITRERLAFEGSAVRPPDGPGLGVTLNPDSVAKFRVDKR